MKKQNLMDGDSKNLEKNINRKFSNMEHDDSSILQPVWIRHRPVLADDRDWQFMASELRFVLFSGAFLWTLYLLSLAL